MITMIDNITIRLVNEQDFEALCRLYFEFHNFHAQGVPDYLRSLDEPNESDCLEMYENLRNIINGENSVIFLAEVPGQIIGFAEMYIRQGDATNSALVARQYGYLQSLMVLDTFRRQGVGKQLMQIAQEWAKNRGATEIQLDIWEFDAGPLRFYEKAGYKTVKRTLVKKL